MGILPVVVEGLMTLDYEEIYEISNRTPSRSKTAASMRSPVSL